MLVYIQMGLFCGESGNHGASGQDGYTRNLKQGCKIKEPKVEDFKLLGTLQSLANMHFSKLYHCKDQH